MSSTFWRMLNRRIESSTETLMRCLRYRLSSCLTKKSIRGALVPKGESPIQTHQKIQVGFYRSHAELSNRMIVIMQSQWSVSESVKECSVKTQFCLKASSFGRMVSMGGRFFMIVVETTGCGKRLRSVCMDRCSERRDDKAPGFT